MEYPMKYDVKISINKMEFVNESDGEKFRDDFDEVYNVFMVKLGDLLDEYGVQKIDAYLNPIYLIDRK